VALCCDHSAVASLCLDALTSNYASALASMRTQVLIIVGDSSISADTISERYRSLIPSHGAHFALLAGATHCPHHQHEQLPKLQSLLQQLLDGSMRNNASPGCLPPRSTHIDVLGDAMHRLNQYVGNSGDLKQERHRDLSQQWQTAIPAASPRVYVPPLAGSAGPSRRGSLASLTSSSNVPSSHSSFAPPATASIVPPISTPRAAPLSARRAPMSCQLASRGLLSTRFDAPGIRA